MKKVVQKSAPDAIIKSIQKKYGDLGYTTDAQMHKALRERGVPTLSKLLKKLNTAK